jgi:hypothetical protein
MSSLDRERQEVIFAQYHLRKIPHLPSDAIGNYSESIQTDR